VISNPIAKRYARAFFEIAGEQKRYEEYGRELDRFSAVLKGNEGLRGFLANPVVDQADKKAVVESILTKAAFSPLTASFLRLLVDKRRIGILSDIALCYRELMDLALNKVRVSVKTAFPLSEALSRKLQTGLEKMTGKRVEMTVLEDPSLLGGIVVQVGDTLYDGSIKAQLNQIRILLGEER
jgi:F-type H+-transporting ATPase subunit delta